MSNKFEIMKKCVEFFISNHTLRGWGPIPDVDSLRYWASEHCRDTTYVRFFSWFRSERDLQGYVEIPEYSEGD